MDHIFSYSRLKTTEWPEDVFIEGGLLSRGDTMLIGAESKGGKSTLIAGFIRELISGGSILGFKVTRPLKVLYIQAELREGRLIKRLEPTYDKLKDEHKANFFTWSTRGLVLLEAHMKDIVAAIEYTNPDTVVFDPMINFHTHDENDSQQMTGFFRVLDNIKERFNIAIIMAHHFRKAAGNKNAEVSLLDRIRGSSSMRGWAVTTIAMEGRTSTEYRELAFDLRNSDEPIRRIIKYNPITKDFDWHDPLFVVTEWATTFLNGSEVPTKVFIAALLGEHGNLLSHNKNKAQALKDALINTKIICERIDGKFHYISSCG